MAISRSSSAMARLSRSVAAAAAFRASGSGAGAAHQVPRFTTPSCDSQSVRSALSRALFSPNQNKIPNAFSTSCLNRGFAFSPALARCYSTSAATAQFPGVKENSALNATLAKVKSLSLFWHINDGIEEIMADYVHQETTRTWILVCFRLFLIIIIKDVFLALTHL